MERGIASQSRALKNCPREYLDDFEEK